MRRKSVYTVIKNILGSDWKSEKVVNFSENSYLLKMHKNLSNNTGTQVQVVLMKLRGIVKSTGQVIEAHEVHKHNHAP